MRRMLQRVGQDRLSNRHGVGYSFGDPAAAQEAGLSGGEARIRFVEGMGAIGSDRVASVSAFIQGPLKQRRAA